MFTLSHAIEAYRTVEWVTTESARFGSFLREDPAKGRRGNQGADHAVHWAISVRVMGLASGLLSVNLVLQGQFQAAMLALLWAVIFDQIKGWITPNLSVRTEEQKLFVAKMDPPVDLVIFAAGPGIFC